MVLLATGCSNTYGSETGRNEEGLKYAFGKYVAQYLNAEYVNIAHKGSNNIGIVNRTINWIEQNCIKKQKYNFSELFVLVGWTQNGRFFFEKHNRYVTCKQVVEYALSNNNKILKSNFFNRIKEKQNYGFIEKIDPTGIFSRILYEEVINGIEDISSQVYAMIGLDNFLKKYKINYFTFPTLCISDIEKYKHLTDLLCPKHNFPFIYQNKPFLFTQYFGKQCIAPGGHLNKLGHIRASLWITEQLKGRNII